MLRGSYIVYGDNLHECHKFIQVLKLIDRDGFRFVGEKGKGDRPIHIIETYNDIKFGLAIGGRFEDFPKKKPEIGWEDPDIVITRLHQDGKQIPIFEVEDNNALSAGNQEWQRFPRIMHAAERGIPFVYQKPMFEAEADPKTGSFRSLRRTIVTVQFGQYLLTKWFNIESLTVFAPNEWLKDGFQKHIDDAEYSEKFYNSILESKENYAKFAAGVILCDLQGDNDSVRLGITLRQEGVKNLERNMYAYLDLMKEKDLTAFDGLDIFQPPFQGDVNRTQPFEKLKLKEVLPKFNKVVQKKSCVKGSSFYTILYPIIKNQHEELGLFSYKSGQNEFALIPEPKRFYQILLETYPSIGETTGGWFSRHETEPMLFVPIAGYVKDSGGPAFSRPDKGLVGFIGIFSQFMKTLGYKSVVFLLYNKLIPDNWIEQLLESQKDTSKGNNLWRELSQVASVVIVDKTKTAVVLRR